MEESRQDAAFRAAIATQAVRSDRRIERFEWEERAVWIKRFHVPDSSIGRSIHENLSPIVPIAFLRASKRVDARGRVDRERRKRDAFHRSGITVPEMVWFDATMIAMADEGPSVEKILKSPPPGWGDAEHGALIRLVAEELGRVHAAGLCHGRPHPRDMALRDGRVVFFDFEEEPEEVMPLVDAQARDALVLFFQLTARSRNRAATTAALDAYRRTAPAETQNRLRQITSTLRPSARFCAALRLDRYGADVRRFVGATLFLAGALVSPDMPLGPGLDASQTTAVMRKSTSEPTDKANG